MPIKRFYMFGGNNYIPQNRIQQNLISQLQNQNNPRNINLLQFIKTHPVILMTDPRYPDHVWVTHETSMKILSANYLGIQEKVKHYLDPNIMFRMISPWNRFKITNIGSQIDNDKNFIPYLWTDQFLNAPKDVIVASDINSAPLAFKALLQNGLNTTCSTQLLTIETKKVLYNAVSDAAEKETLENQISNCNYTIEFLKIQQTNSTYTKGEILFFKKMQKRYENHLKQLFPGSNKVEEGFYSKEKELSNISILDSKLKKIKLENTVLLSKKAKEDNMSLQKEIILHDYVNISLLHLDFSERLALKYNLQQQMQILPTIFNNKHGEAIFNKEAAYLNPVEAVHSTIFKMNNPEFINATLTEEQFRIGEMLTKRITDF